MDWTMFNVGSVTNAMRGKALLERRGFTVQMQRAFSAEDNNGCGYRLLVKGDGHQARVLLENAGVRIGKTANGGKS
jgi:hypothetical protein